MRKYTFPDVNFNLIDRSGIIAIEDSVKVIHQPIFFVHAERGKTGIPVYGNATQLRQEFGSEFLNPTSKFFNHPNVFLREALKYQNCWVVRLADTTAKVAGNILVLNVFEDSGKVYLEWVSTTIDDIRTSMADPSLTWDTLETTTWSVTKTINTVSITGTAYPMIAMDALTVGESSNYAGISLYWDPQFEESRQENMESVVYNIGYVRKDPESEIVGYIRDIFNEKTIEFTPKENTVDNITNGRYYFDEQVRSSFRNNSGKAPYPTKFYSKNFETVGNTCIAAEYAADMTVPRASQPYLVNLLTAKDIDNTPYTNIEMFDDINTGNTLSMLKGNNHWMTGGSDGIVSKEQLELLTADYLGDNATGTLPYPELGDRLRYQYNTLYDSGYGQATKSAIINFMGFNPNVIVLMSTHVDGQEPNNGKEDQSSAASLIGQILMNPESEMYGTGACRAGVFQQCGLIYDSGWPNWIPATLHWLIKSSQAYNSISVKNVPKGKPFSVVDIFDEWSWTPVSKDHKQLSWDTSANYFQHSDINEIFYPDVVSVYDDKSSLLSSLVMIYYVIIAKQTLDRLWTDYSGSEQPFSELVTKLTYEATNRLGSAFNNFITFKPTFYRSTKDAIDMKGITCDLELYGNDALRVMTINGIILRAE